MLVSTLVGGCMLVGSNAKACTTESVLSMQLIVMKDFLNEWKQTLHKMRLDHPELCLFKIYKVFQMFKALQSKQVEKLTQEMLLLFTDAHQTGLELVKTIQVSMLFSYLLSFLFTNNSYITAAATHTYTVIQCQKISCNQHNGYVYVRYTP